MSRSSHPPSLLTLVKKTLTEGCALSGGERLAVAVSGGPDSMALLHCLWLCRQQLGLSLLALTVDHGLRPEAGNEVGLVERFCAQHEIACSVVHLHLEKGSNLHARARAARYEQLWLHAEQRLGPACFLATAHHRDDRAETVLLRMLRGTSLAGLGVLPPRSDRLLRPLVYASRVDVELHLQRHQVASATDPSNVDPRYLRSRVRGELLPLLKELGPGIVEHLTALAEEAAELPEPLGLNREHRAQLRRANLDPGASIDLRLPGGLRLVRERKTD